MPDVTEGAANWKGGGGRGEAEEGNRAEVRGVTGGVSGGEESRWWG